MASFLYLKAKESFLSQNPSIDLDTDTIKVTLINLATDNASHANTLQYLSSITAYSGVTAQTLSSKTVTSGVFDAGDVTFSAVSISGTKVVNGAVIYKDTGTASTSPLIAWVEFTSSITPNGGDISIAWDNGANKIFALN